MKKVLDKSKKGIKKVVLFIMSMLLILTSSTSITTKADYPSDFKQNEFEYDKNSYSKYVACRAYYEVYCTQKNTGLFASNKVKKGEKLGHVVLRTYWLLPKSAEEDGSYISNILFEIEVCSDDVKTDKNGLISGVPIAVGFGIETGTIDSNVVLPASDYVKYSFTNSTDTTESKTFSFGTTTTQQKNASLSAELDLVSESIAGATIGFTQNLSNGLALNWTKGTTKQIKSEVEFDSDGFSYAARSNNNGMAYWNYKWTLSTFNENDSLLPFIATKYCSSQVSFCDVKRSTVTGTKMNAQITLTFGAAYINSDDKDSRLIKQNKTYSIGTNTYDFTFSY